jgi:hypothetical protein
MTHSSSNAATMGARPYDQRLSINPGSCGDQNGVIDPPSHKHLIRCRRALKMQTRLFVALAVLSL